MAKYNEILIGRWNRFIQKLTGIKGEPPAAQLAGEISFTHPIFHGVENRYLEAWNRFGISTGTSAVAAQNSGFRFRNPKTSGAVAVVEKIVQYNPSAAVLAFQVSIGTTNADFATSVSASTTRLDARLQTVHSIMSLSIGNNVVAVGFPFLGGSIANAGPPLERILFEEQEITVLPGDALDFTTITVNVALNTDIVWRERVLEEGELA